MTDDGPDIFARIVATEHAVERARERLDWDGGKKRIATDVRAEVRVGLLAGRVASVKPEWVREPHRSRAAARDGCWYVWDRDGTRCWAIEESKSAARTLIVTTLLLAVDTIDHEAKKVRTGMRRR